MISALEKQQQAANVRFAQLIDDFEKEVVATAGAPYEERVKRASVFLKKCREEGVLEELQTLFTCLLGSFINDEAFSLMRVENQS